MRGLVMYVLIAGCYAPTTAPGTPCTPALANCPRGQQCALVGGEHVCVTDLPPIDAAGDLDAMAMQPDAPDGAVPRWTLLQTRGSTGNDTAIAATTAGSTIIVGIETPDVVPVDQVTDTANNTYTRVTDSRAINDARDLGVELWYATNASAGATRVIASAATVYATVVWEVAGLAPSPVGAVARRDDQPATTTPAGAPITTATPGELVISIAIVANQVSGLTAGSAFTNDHTTFGNGWAHLTSNAAPPGTYQAQWTQPTSGPYCATTAAFRLAP